MQPNIIKDTVCAVMPVYSAKYEQNAETGITLPDYQPEIMRVIKTSAEVFVTGRQITERQLVIEGSVKFCVTYVSPEGELCSAVQNAVWRNSSDADIPIDAFIIAEPTIERTVAQPTGARKLDVACWFRLSVRVFGCRRTDYLVEADSVQLLRETCRVRMFDGIFKKMFAVSDDIELPASQPPIQRLICSRMILSGTGCSLVSGRAVIKSKLILTLLYIGDLGDGIPIRSEFEIPFNQLLDIGEVSPDSDSVCDLTIASYSLNTVTDSDGMTRRLALDTVVNAQVMCVREADLTFVSDCFCVKRDVTPEYSIINAFGSCEKTSLQLRTDDVIELNGRAISRIIGCEAELVAVSANTNDDILRVVGTFGVSVTALDENGETVFIDRQLQFEKTEQISDNKELCNITVQLCECRAQISGERINVAIEAIADVTRCEKLDGRVVSSLEFGDAVECKKDETLVLCYKSANERIWDIAKRYRVSVDEIEALNSLYPAAQNGEALILIPRI